MHLEILTYYNSSVWNNLDHWTYVCEKLWKFEILKKYNVNYIIGSQMNISWYREHLLTNQKIYWKISEGSKVKENYALVNIIQKESI